MKHIIKLDMEPWQFILYEVDGTDWIVNFPYSPISSVDVSMSIKLNTEEKLRAKENRQFLIEFSETLRNNHKAFQERALDFNISIKYKELLHGA
jgi:hypothetical protein